MQCSWKMCKEENTFDIGWIFDEAHLVCGTAGSISAAMSCHNFAQPNLRITSALTNMDHNACEAACNKEYDGSDGLNVFTEISTEKCKNHPKKHGNNACSIPTMNLFAIKPNQKGNPIRAKSRVVDLRNLEQRV